MGAEVLRFLAHRRRTASTKTYLNNNTVLTVQFVPFIGADTPTDAIDAEEMQRWVDRLAKRYSIGTIRSDLSVPGASFRWRTDGAHDPTRGVKLPDQGERDVEPWTDEELATLRTAADALDKEVREGTRTGPPGAIGSYRLALEAALATGCRIAELAALDWSAFDADERTVRVRWQIAPDGYGTALQPLKGRRNRTALVLPSWWDVHRPGAAGGVMLGLGAATIGHRTVERWFDTLIVKAGVKRDRQNAHQARHTYARLALEMGARLEELQRFLGHASIKTTERYYGWLTEQSATTLARARIYGEGLHLVGPIKSASRKLS